MFDIALAFHVRSLIRLGAMLFQLDCDGHAKTSVRNSINNEGFKFTRQDLEQSIGIRWDLKRPAGRTR